MENKSHYRPEEVQGILRSYESGKWHYDARKARKYQASAKKLESLAEQGNYWLNSIPENVRTPEVKVMINNLQERKI